ncbi:Uncharacterized protein TCM_021627 [Theobroma cacao]|uniref:Uncharacterized protein n=1 Tax=Theobroma cacao TaxID=3641 RepID=A0A061EQJ9_THECC|nr:Uncharacterized protein TCM_021627 [Theobroma cacao]
MKHTGLIKSLLGYPSTSQLMICRFMETLNESVKAQELDEGFKASGFRLQPSAFSLPLSTDPFDLSKIPNKPISIGK